MCVEVYNLFLSEIENSKLFERVNFSGYPDSPFGADIWEHSFKTSYKYPELIIFRNRNKTEPISDIIQ